MQKVDLLEGSIVRSLTSLALPIMATSLIQMAYNMTDMIWIGRVSANAVAAVGAAGMYLWLANGLAMIPRLGGQVKVAHELGAQNIERAASYGQAAFHLGALLVVLFTTLCITLNGPLIAFFRLNTPSVIADARTYLVIVAAGFFFSFFNQIFTGMFTAMGGSVVVLRSTAIGLVGNIILDPLMIFGIGPFPQMGVAGAATATVLAQAIVTAMFLLAARREMTVFPQIHIFQASQWRAWAEILKIGLPVSIQSMFFSGLSMILARLVAGWGDAAIAAQKVGSQIESISYTTAEGFATAVNAFIAQNFGAGRMERIRKGYILDPLMIFGIGPFPQMGVAGAATATVLAQAIVTAMFLLAARREMTVFPQIHIFQASQWRAWAEILKIGLPVSIQSMFFSGLSMILARLVAGWGDAAIAAQKVGSQIESISYTTAEGFATAVNAFIAQNFGAGRMERIRKGYWTAIGMIVVWSGFTTLMLVVFPVPLFRIFIPDDHVLQTGVSYLRIMGYSQILMCLEITSSGAFQGLGRPMPPTLAGIIGNAARIPLAVFLSATVLGLDGVWWSISISSIAKGIVVFTWFVVILRRYTHLQAQGVDGLE